MALRQLIREHEPLQDGQRELAVTVKRVVKLGRPENVVVSAPRASAAAVAFAIGGRSIADAVKTVTHREKVIGMETERFVWMKPDGKGGLIPR